MVNDDGLLVSECCEKAKGAQEYYRKGEGAVRLAEYTHAAEDRGPYWVLDTYSDDGGDGIEIHFCPFCGTKLEIPADVQRDIDMNKSVEEGFDEEGSEPSSATEEADSES